MDILNEPIDRIASPRFANELHVISQGLTAFLGGFVITAFLIAEPHIGPILCALGVACVFPAWLIASLGTRMVIEIGLAILAIHHHIAWQQLPPQGSVPADSSDDKEIEG